STLLETESRAERERVPVIPAAARLRRPRNIRIRARYAHLAGWIETVAEGQSTTLGSTRAGIRSEELDVLATESDLASGVRAKITSDTPASAHLAQRIATRRKVAIGRRGVITVLMPANGQAPI